MKTILIVDDHPFFREGLKSLLARHPGFEVVGEADTGEMAFRKAKELNPDLVLMDISLPDGSGLDVTHAIRTSLPETQVVILSMHSKVDFISKAFRAGAKGYVVKESATERVVECLEAVSRGQHFMDPSLHHKVVDDVMKSREREAKMTDVGYNALTPREQEVMRLLAQGLSTKEISDKLFISRKTVDNHRSNVMRKLDLHTTVELVRYAAKFGLIDVAAWQK
jgi:DNA-binding NarL/FixJ family response regulator